MKKNQILTLSLLGLLTVTGCNMKAGDDSKSIQPEKTNFEKAISVVADFDIENTNGFDYSLKQYLGRDETNSDTVSLRVDFSGDIKAEKSTTSKRLNEYGAGEQFTITETTTYFSNNMICEYKNDNWKWSNCKKSDYFANAISKLSFDESYLASVKESLNNNYVLTADIQESKIKDFLGADSSFSSASLELTVSADFKRFESLEISYFQQQTRSEMKFTVYRGEVSINLPN